MKVFITKYNNETLCHEALVIPNLNYENPTFVKVDFFVGCSLTFPEAYTDHEKSNILEKMVGSIYEIKDDTLICNDVYLPSEKDLIL